MSEADYLAQIRRLVSAVKFLESKLETAQNTKAEPIAIVGLGCRFPGGGTGPEAFWRLLDAGVDAVTEIPAERWSNAEESDAADPSKGGVRWGSFLNDVDLFDPHFFEISPREAASLDPQQRLLLEVTWEALEHAGQVPERLMGSRTGVFVGISTNDYVQICTENGKANDIYTVTGNTRFFPAGRLSYVLGLQGPSLAVDTGCSASLVAVHLACQSLRNGESTLAVAAGVNLMLVPGGSAMAATTGALSPTGRCKTFDACADGMVRGEGCGVVVLKRLSDALADGDRILALIRGSAVNQDGRSTGLTAPNVLSQQALLRQALESARVSPAEIGYVEMHGTGTPLGDPIEAEALSAVLGAPRPDGSVCALGAVKTNLGHLEAAAGVAGLIKAVLALQHRKIPPNLHYKTLNPRISLDGTSLVIPQKALEWKTNGKPRFAGVSSFGMGGTNAHVVLEEAPVTAALPAAEDGMMLLPLSAKSPEALVALAETYRSFLTKPTSEPLRDIVYTASVRRAHHAHRLALLGSSREELCASLEAFGRGELLAGMARGEAPAEARPKVVFVYPGQGSQWVGMGRQLLAEEPVFRRAMEACDTAIQREGGFSVLDELCADESKSKLAQFDIVQPMLFAIEVALTALWRSWGVEPDAVVGHSMGEVAAAHVAGALSLEDAAAVVCRRSRILRKVSGEGVMAWCELSMEQAEAALRDYASRLSIAASNGPRSTVVSGEPGALDEMLAKLAKEDVFFRRVKVSDVASHSPKMEPLLGEVMATLSTIAPRASQVPIYSTVTGTLIAGEALGAAYWVRNLRDRVLFSQGIERLLAEGHTVFVEMSPHPSLLPSIEERGRQDGGKTVLISSLRRGREGRRELLSSLGALYAHGYPVAFPKLYPSGGRCVSLPTYPWQRERYWIEASGPTNGVAKPVGARRGGGPSHPLLGSSFTIATQEGQRFWEKELSVEVLPYLADHRVEGDVVLPGAAYVEMALSAAIEAYGHEAYVVEDIAFERMLALPPHGVRIVQTTLSEQNEGYASLQISSRMPTDKTWVRHATAGLRRGERAAPPTQGNEALSAIQARCPTPMSAAEYYPRVQERGVEFGPSFRGIERLWIGTGEVIGRVRLPEEGVEDASAYQLHPALLDACFQVLGGLWLGQEAAAGKEKVHVSVGVERARFEGRPGPALWVHGRLREAEGNGEEGFTADLRLLDDDGHLVGEAVGLRVKPLSPSAKALREPYETWLHALSWRRKDHDAEVSGSPTSPAAGAFLLWMDRGETGTALSKLLNERGESCVRVVAGERYARLDEGMYQVDPSDPEGYRAVLHEAFSKERPCRGVVHLWSLDATATADTSAEALLSAQRQSSVSALYLAQALLRAGFRDQPRFVLVTRGAQAVATERHAVQVAQAPLWGLGRTLGMEHPELGCTLLDLSPRPEAGEAFSLWRELLASDGEDQVALREGVRHVARLVRSTLGVHDAPRLGADKSYLISGGLGGLGLSVAAWMVREGARHLTLVGRSRPSAAAQAALAALEEAGAKVRVVAADVSRRVEVERVLTEMEQNSPPLGGVVHAAVVLEDRSALELSGESFDKVMAPKMQGAWNLHVLTRDTPLDFFVLYSSAASLLGLPGQSNDAAANAFLDALAHHRQNLGLSALSINWGAFSQVGLAAAQENRGERLSSRGIRSLSPAQGVDVLGRLLGGAHAQIGVLDLNLRQWLQFYPSAARMPVFSELLRESSQEKPGAGEASRFRETLAKAAPGERATLLEQHVGEELGQILRLPAARIERKASFSRLGVDSLMSLELRNRLEVSLGLKLSATLLFTYTNLATMAEHLLDKMNLREGAENGASSRHVEDEAPIDNAAAADIKELSDDDLLAAFDLSLNRIKTENLQ